MRTKRIAKCESMNFYSQNRVPYGGLFAADGCISAHTGQLKMKTRLRIMLAGAGFCREEHYKRTRKLGVSGIDAMALGRRNGRIRGVRMCVACLPDNVPLFIRSFCCRSNLWDRSGSVREPRRFSVLLRYEIPSSY